MTYNISAASTEAAHCANAPDPDVRILHRVSPLENFPLAPSGKGPFRKLQLLTRRPPAPIHKPTRSSTLPW